MNGCWEQRMSHGFWAAQPEGSRRPITRGTGWLQRASSRMETHYTLHLHTYTDTHTSTNTAATVGIHNLGTRSGKLVNEMAREGMECVRVWVCAWGPVCLNVSASVSVSLFGGEQHDTQVLFWSIKSMRGTIEKNQSVSALRGVLCRPMRTGVG